MHADNTGIKWSAAFDHIANSASWVCPVCQKAKMRTVSRMPPRDEAKATRPFQRIYVDTVEILAMDMSGGTRDLPRSFLEMRSR